MWQLKVWHFPYVFSFWCMKTPSLIFLSMSYIFIILLIEKKNLDHQFLIYVSHQIFSLFFIILSFTIIRTLLLFFHTCVQLSIWWRTEPQYFEYLYLRMFVYKVFIYNFRFIYVIYWDLCDLFSRICVIIIQEFCWTILQKDFQYWQPCSNFDWCRKKLR